MNIYFWLPVILIFVIFCIVGLIIIVHFVSQEKKVKENEKNVFDERKKVEQYRAGYISFLFGIAYVFVSTMIVGYANFSRGLNIIIMLGGVSIPFAIYICICIWKDAFQSTKQPSNSLLAIYIIWTAIFLINGLLRLKNIAEDEDNFTIGLMFIMFAVVFFVILMNILAKKISDKKASSKLETK